MVEMNGGRALQNKVPPTVITDVYLFINNAAVIASVNSGTCGGV